MTSDEMSVTHVSELGRDELARTHTLVATSVKFTALWRICRRRYVALQNYSLYLRFGVGNRYRREKCFRVRMHRRIEHLALSAVFHHRAEIHNSDVIGNMLYDGEVVRYENIRQMLGFL